MKIRTTFKFKTRRLAEYTKKSAPDFLMRNREKIKKKWLVLNEDWIEKEIFNSCVILKNLTIVYRDRPLSADFILEQLLNNSSFLRNTYAETLSAYRTGKDEESFNILYERVPVKEMREFSSILSKLDQINPAELSTYISSFEEVLISRRVTKGIRRAERKSIVTTLIATAAVFSILLNFVIVVVFMDAVRLLGQVF